MPRKPDFIMPTDEEDARINQGIALDADSPELTEADFQRAEPASAIVPDPADRLKQDGPGWQGCMNDMLREAVGR